MRRVALLLALAFVVPSALPAQSADARIRAQQQELERIRRERSELERRMASLQGNVHDLREEIDNLDRQREATERVLATLDRQIASIEMVVDQTTERLSSAQSELVVRQATLQRRLVEIYKRGPLYTPEALLTARSFGELIARYKYLHEIAVHDRALVRGVEKLRDDIARQRGELVKLRDAVADSRTEKQKEEERLALLTEQSSSNLARAQRSTKAIQARLAKIRESESRLTNVIATIEAERRRAASRANAPKAASTLRSADEGRLDWPVDGSLLYRFGRVVNPNNTTTRWNGVGIAAPEGAPVKAVAPGTVVSVGQLGTYGLTVILQHGDGDYSVYASLAAATVRNGETVKKGERIGTVGVSDPDLKPHLHFEIRPKGHAVDPERWLREHS
ncbi:MAG TPA: peptidoglycan DD-metalloendopeptidase family protein [Gemmatimonadaceae bacterium]|nr:peptidoglycan DD-metalloendopeptidase family protein [Gemmatimonadaceae bacterium]